MDKPVHAPLILLPYHQDILQVLSQHIIERQRDCLPDLSQVIILLSNTHAATHLRQLLLGNAKQSGVQALLGPQIFSLQGWIEQHPLRDTRVISDHARELMLVEALMDYPHLYRDSNPWLLATNLMELFDELTRQHITLPDTLDNFIEQLGQAYGLPDTSHTALGQEATLVHTLWRAMQQQLQSIQYVDRHTGYIMRLAQSLETITPAHHVYVAGLFDFIPAEIQWLNTLLAKTQLTLITQTDGIDGPADDAQTTILSTHQRWMQQLDAEFSPFTGTVDHDNTCADFFHQCFNYEAQPLLLRAASFASQQTPSPVQSALHVFTAANAEEEAQAIDLQIRQWLLQGKRRIAVVTENRRLARRLRAILERAGIILQDAAGWALSTTSAATVIERWLESVEQDFHYQPLLDFLKSPFVCLQPDKDQHLTAVHRLEQGVVQHENIASNLQRYRQHTQYRLKRLSAAESGYYDGVLDILEQLEKGAATLVQLLSGKHHPSDYVEALQQSLSQLQVWQALANDAAGQRIQEQLQQIHIAAQHVDMAMDWTGFRTWLGANLERSNFQPPGGQQRVQLLGLSQSDLQQYDGIIIAAAEQEYLPGKPGLSPFFNDAVRTRLGIPTYLQRLTTPFQHFRRLLECAQRPSGNNASTDSSTHHILITRRHAEHDEEIIASPWLTAIQSFHQLAYRNNLQDRELAALVSDPRIQIKPAQQRLLPQPLLSNTTTAVPAAMLPHTLSASAYQQLMDCPYQFFAARCLQLKPPERVRELLEKDDYGNRVHACLEAFHHPVPGLPGPFKEVISENNRAQALQLLVHISEQIFLQDIEDNFLHRGWLKHWLGLAPHYIDWQIARNKEWRPSLAEYTLRDIPFADHLNLSGVLDRIDRQQDTLAIIDYKTGFVPKQDEIDNGEAVQLPYYALLIKSGMETQPQVERVEYVSLTNTKVGTQGYLEGEQLHTLSEQVGERLRDVMHELRNGKPVTAWGDSRTCRYCSMNGLCRKDIWQQALTQPSE